MALKTIWCQLTLTIDTWLEFADIQSAKSVKETWLRRLKRQKKKKLLTSPHYVLYIGTFFFPQL